MPGAGTDSSVWIVLNGENGSTRKMPLDAKGNQFERGKTNSFDIKSVDLGKLSKIRIGHDNSNAGEWNGFVRSLLLLLLVCNECTMPGAGWHLARVEVAKVVDDKVDEASKMVFSCNRWFDTKEDDGALGNLFCPLPT